MALPDEKRDGRFGFSPGVGKGEKQSTPKEECLFFEQSELRSTAP